jgi:hypothetical protein
MTTTASQAIEAIRARLSAQDSGITIPLRFQGEKAEPLPDSPAAFAFVVFNNDGSGGRPVAFGGGRGANLYRNRATVEAYVFAPRDDGMSVVMGYAETIASRLRSFRDENVSCFSADVIPVGPGSNISPPGLNAPVTLYQCAIAEAVLQFDQIG